MQCVMFRFFFFFVCFVCMLRVFRVGFRDFCDFVQDLDAREEHSWDVESGSAGSFPLPMNILSAGFGKGTREYARPS